MGTRRKLISLVALIMLNSELAAQDLLFVDLTINHRFQGATLMLHDSFEHYYASISDLAKWGVRGPYLDRVEYDGREFARLGALGKITVAYEQRTATAAISIPAELLPTQQLEITRRSTPETVSSTGAYLDYDWSYTSADKSFASGLLAPTFFSDVGALHTQFLYQGYDPPPGTFRTLQDGPDDWIRLDTTFTRDFPDRMRSLRVGDVINQPSPWGNAQRVGGIQFASNFATQPSFISFPIPGLQGSANLPSTLDLYVDGALRHRQNIEAGPFRVDEVPVVTGAGQMQMVVTDILGREQVYTQDFYAGADLLRSGLSSYSYTIGALRSDFGYASNHYGDTVALGEHRYGVNEYLTVGGRAEISGASKLASATVTWSPQRTGIVNAGLGISDSRSGSGSSWLIGYQFQTRGYNVSAQATGTSKRFANVGLQPFYSVPKTQIVINGGWRSGQAGSFGAALVHTDYHDAVSRDIVTLNHSKTFFGRYYFSLFANYVKDDRSDFSLGLNVSTSFGARRNASANILQNRRDSQLRMQMQSTLPNGPGIGYRLGKTIGGQERFDGRFTGQTDYGRYGIDVDRLGNSTSVRTSASGSVAWLANRPYFAREINDGFAVARVGDIGNVRVYVENQEVGRSDKDGRLLLPRLRPYEINRIRIEPVDLPFSAQIQTVSIEVAPAFRSGIVIDFPVTTSSFALLSARLPNGEPVPGGATVHLSGKDQTTIVGLDGAIYATGPAGVTDLQVEWSSQTCHFTIELPAQTETLAHLGEFECSPVTQ